MAHSYVPPGVTITEVVAPQVVPLISSSSEVVLVGLTLGHQIRTDQVRLGGSAFVTSKAEKIEIAEASKVVKGFKTAKKLIQIGSKVTGEGIPAGTTVAAVTSETEIELSEKAKETNEEAILTFELDPTELPFLASLPGSKLEKVLSVYSATNPAEGENEGLGFKEYKEGSGAWKEDRSENAVVRISGGLIGANQLVNVTYQYVPAGYYNPIRLFGVSEVVNRFGSPEAKNEKGELVSPLSLAAQKAFESGARNIILQPLFNLIDSDTEPEYDANGFIINAEQPSATAVATATTWGKTLKALDLVQTIDLITPVIGQGNAEGKVKNNVITAIIKEVLGYEQKREVEEKFIFGVFGEDSTGETSEALASAVHTHAQEVRSYAGGALASHNVLVNVTNIGISLTEGGEESIGGQYLAAAVAGAMASRPVASSLTRKGITGFTKVKTLKTTAQKNEDAEEGLMVIEQIQNGQIRCRHAITLDTGHGAARSEVSVVRAKFLMIESVKETLENQIIGQIIADSNSPIIVRSAIVGVLSALQSAGDLVDFKTPIVALASTEPTTITASFSYRPAFTLNYIDISFSLDLSSQTVTITENSQSGTLGE